MKKISSRGIIIEDDNSIAHFYRINIISGTPILGGEEKERCNEDNYYEIRKIKISYIEKIIFFQKI